MELYPRIGKSFDLKTWTNCRMGMMGWAVIILCYAVKQLEATGTVADSMLVSVTLMQIYIAKFFLCAKFSSPALPTIPLISLFLDGYFDLLNHRCSIGGAVVYGVSLKHGCSLHPVWSDQQFPHLEPFPHLDERHSKFHLTFNISLVPEMWHGECPQQLFA